jgi:chromatin remodeling complex protein RSC6
MPPRNTKKKSATSKKANTNIAQKKQSPAKNEKSVEKADTKVEKKTELNVETLKTKVETTDTKVDSKSEVESKTKTETNVEPEPELLDQIQEMAAKFDALGKQLKQYAKDLKKIGREHTKMLKEANKGKKNTKKKPRPNNQNQGFNKPVKISDQMADFVGVEHGSLVSRNTCTNRFNAYVKEKGLQNPAFRREIFPDETIKALLLNGGPKEEPLTYFNYRTYIKHHFIKESAK